MNPYDHATFSSRAEIARRVLRGCGALALCVAAMCLQRPAMAVDFEASDQATLREALRVASANGQDNVIVLAAGTYPTDGTPYTFVASGNRTLTLRAANDTVRNRVVLDAGGAGRVLEIQCASTCGTFIVQGMTIQKGNVSDGNGGGILTSASLVLSDVMLADNSSGYLGGALATTSAAVGVSVTGSGFNNNTASGGGAIYASGVNVTKSIFSNNTVNGQGGAIFGSGSVTNSLFYINLANSGGAIYANAALILVNNTFGANSAGILGNDIYLGAGGSIINSVFFGRYSNLNAFIYSVVPYNLYNNLIDTSTDAAGAPPVVSGNVAPGAISPFVNSGIEDYRLIAGSGAINTALDPNSTTFANLVGGSVADVRQALLTDLLGNPRPTPGTAVDMGAYEFLPDREPPTVPALSATGASTSQVYLSWLPATDNVGVTGYRLYRDSALLAKLAGNVTSFMNNGLEALVTYRYTLQACDAAGNCSARSAVAVANPTGLEIYGFCGTARGVASASAPASGLCASGAPGAVTGSNVQWNWTCAGSFGNATGTFASCSAPRIDTQPPAAPTGLSATAASPTQINLSWTAATDNVGVTSYRVYRGGALIATLGNVTSYSNTGLAPSTPYSYTVQACDAAGNCSAQSAAATATTAPLPVNGACGAANGVASVATPSAALCSSGAASAVTGSSVQWAWTCAGSAGGSTASCSAPRPDTQAPSVPTGLSATPVSSSQINLAWTASTDNVGVTAYKVYRDGFLIAVLGNVTNFSNIGLAPATTYSYTVQACDAADNCSARSAAASATTAPTFTTRSDCLFNWAERNYASLFSPANAISNTLSPYYFRYYPQTNTYLGTSSADNHVYFVGPPPNNSLRDLGDLAGWLSLAGCQ